MRDFNFRALAGTAIVSAAGLASLLLGKPALLVFVAVLLLLATGQLFRLARASGTASLSPVGLAGVLALSVAGHVRGEFATSAFGAIVSATLGLAFTVMILRSPRAGVIDGLTSTLVPVLTVGLLGAYILAIRGIPHGVRVVLGFVVIAAAADLARVAARAHGPARRVGATLAGALVGGIVAAGLLGRAFSWGNAAIIAILIAPVVAGSDAITTLIERALGAARRELRAPLLRRADALILTAPVFFYAYRALAR